MPALIQGANLFGFNKIAATPDAPAGVQATQGLPRQPAPAPQPAPPPAPAPVAQPAAAPQPQPGQLPGVPAPMTPKPEYVRNPYQKPTDILDTSNVKNATFSRGTLGMNFDARSNEWRDPHSLSLTAGVQESAPSSVVYNRLENFKAGLESLPSMQAIASMRPEEKAKYLAENANSQLFGSENALPSDASAYSALYADKDKAVQLDRLFAETQLRNYYQVHAKSLSDMGMPGFSSGSLVRGSWSLNDPQYASLKKKADEIMQAQLWKAFQARGLNTDTVNQLKAFKENLSPSNQVKTQGDPGAGIKPFEAARPDKDQSGVVGQEKDEIETLFPEGVYAGANALNDLRDKTHRKRLADEAKAPWWHLIHARFGGAYGGVGENAPQLADNSEQMFDRGMQFLVQSKDTKLAPAAREKYRSIGNRLVRDAIVGYGQSDAMDRFNLQRAQWNDKLRRMGFLTEDATKQMEAAKAQAQQPVTPPFAGQTPNMVAPR